MTLNADIEATKSYAKVAKEVVKMFGVDIDGILPPVCSCNFQEAVSFRSRVIERFCSLDAKNITFVQNVPHLIKFIERVEKGRSQGIIDEWLNLLISTNNVTGVWMYESRD